MSISARSSEETALPRNVPLTGADNSNEGASYTLNIVATDPAGMAT